jgi:exodeoxyribonuclease-3
MKITTWNVNGYRAVLKKDFKASIRLLDPDILCLQEVKARVDQLGQDDEKIEGYQHIWNAAERPGYSGVATYIKNGITVPSSPHLGIGIPEADKEGRTIRLEFKDLILYNIYFPNGQRGMDRVEFKLDFYRQLLELCSSLHSENAKIIITGDFNTAHNEIDLANPKENSKVSGFLPEERLWVEKFLNNGFKDAYRELYPDKVEYTWWTYRFTARARNIGWRLDYFLVSDALMQRVQDVIIHNQIEGSDHCPVTLVID